MSPREKGGGRARCLAAPLSKMGQGGWKNPRPFHAFFLGNCSTTGANGAKILKLWIAALCLIALALAGAGQTEWDEIWPDVQPSEGALSNVSRASVSDPRAIRFYDIVGWRPVWSGERAATLTSAIDAAEQHGLAPSMFLSPQLQSQDKAARETALTLAAIDYAEALAEGRLDPEQVQDIYTLPRPNVNIAPLLAEALEKGELAAWLASLAPQDEEYKRLSRAYQDYRQQAQEHSAIPVEGLIHPGDTDPRLGEISKRLHAGGYPGHRQNGSGDSYAPEVVDGVRQLQAEFGLTQDGVIGPETLQTLNALPEERSRQLAANLERRRWLLREPPRTRIDVNTAAALLDYWRDGVHADHRRVIVGRPDWQTPELGSAIYRLVANPSWTVPKSIERESFSDRDSAYLRQRNMVRRDGWIVQLPGPNNALGMVKFDMRNRYAIYLHDTAAKHLFERDQRLRSHGCVRVEDALGFARMLAGHDGTLDQFEEALASGKETYVGLSTEIPVRLIYHTAYLDQFGELRFKPDSYGWDDKLAQALNLGSYRRKAIAVDEHDEIGP